MEPQNTQSTGARQLLSRSLELAREAVKLDGANQDPYAAVQNYSQSIALLDEVLESVAAGADGSDAHKRQRAEEEARRLKSIVSSFMLCSVPIYLFLYHGWLTHWILLLLRFVYQRDTYADRMTLVTQTIADSSELPASKL